MDRRRARWGAGIVAGGAGALLGLVALAALLPDTVVGAAAARVFHVVCHQRAERSFAFAGEALCVCHRCTGIYLGLAIGALFVGLGARVSPASRVLWAVALAPVGLHVLAQWTWPAVDLWWLRVATGLWMGGVMGAALACALGSLLPAPHTHASDGALHDTAGLVPRKEAT